MLLRRCFAFSLLFAYATVFYTSQLSALIATAPHVDGFCVVNVEKLLEPIQKEFQTITLEMQKEFEKGMQEAQKLRQELEAKKASISAIKDSDAPAKLKKIEDELAADEKKTQAKLQIIQTQIVAEQQKAQKSAEALMKDVEKIALEKGIRAVFPNTVLLAHDKSLDKTDMFLAELNKRGSIKPATGANSSKQATGAHKDSFIEKTEKELKKDWEKAEEFAEKATNAVKKEVQEIKKKL